MTDASDLARLSAETAWVRSLARRLVRDAHQADDLAQDALVAAIEQRGPIGSLRAFVATVLRRAVLERGREATARHHRERRSARHEALPSTLDMVERASSQRDLVQAVLELEEPYRTAILWRFFEDLSPRAIARRAGVPVATVHTRLRRGLARLRERLEREHGPEAWVMALLPLTRLPRGASPLGALLVKTSTQIALSTTLLVGAFVAWQLLSEEERATPVPAPAIAAERAHEDPPRVSLPPTSDPGPDAREAIASAPVEEPTPVEEVTPVVPATPRTVRGLVLDDLGGPLPGVALATEPGGERFTSGAGGSFSVALAAPADAIVSADERYATVLAGAAATTADSGAIVVLAPRLVLAGRVIDEGGAGLAGVELTVGLPSDFGTDFGLPLDAALRREWRATSVADGAFRLADVPGVAGGELRASLGGFEPLVEALPRASDAALLLTLVREHAVDGSVRGLVLLPDGDAAVSARVAFGLATTVADERGRFELTAGEGERPEAVRAALRGFAPAETTLAEHHGAWPAELVLRLGASGEAGTIAGRVLGPDGLPVPGARVWLADPTWFGGVEGDVVATESLAARDDRRFWAWVSAAGDGSFVLDGLLPRAYRLRALDPDTLLVVDSEPIPAGTRGVELRLPGDALFERVRGRVVDSTGRGIAGLSVVAQRMALVFEFPGGGTRDEFAPRPAVTTDAEGRFELERVPREDVELFAFGDPILFAAVTLDPDTDPEAVEIRAERRIHLQAELDEPCGRADALRALDGEGRGLVLRIMRGSTSETNPVARIEGCRSHVLSLSERARWVVLLKAGAEVARLPLEPMPDGVNVVRW